MLSAINVISSNLLTKVNPAVILPPAPQRIPTSYINFTTVGSIVVSGQSNSILNGTYTNSRSSQFDVPYSGHLCWITSGGCWATADNFNSSTGAYNNVFSTSVVSIGTVFGEWNQIQFPAAGTFACIKYIYTGGGGEWARDFYLVGSNDGSTWNSIDRVTGLGSNSITRNLSNSTTYYYYRLIITAAAGGVPRSWGKLQLFYQ